MSRNVSPYSLSLKSRLTLLFEIYKGFDHVDSSARLAWKFKLGFYSVLSFNCHSIVNELLRKMIKYEVIIFTQ